jgi:transcriptional regulator with XRE-family HTH domain
VHAGEVIRQRRKELGLSERELARLAHVNQGHLSRVETGQVTLTAPLAAQVARVLGLRLAELLEADQPDGDEPPAEDTVQQIRAALIRGRWPPQIRDSVVGILRATRPGGDGSVNAKSRILLGVG